MKIINSDSIKEKSAQAQADAKNRKRFKASIYIDVWVPDTGSIEQDRNAAFEEVSEIAKNISETYSGENSISVSIGAVAAYTLNLLNPLDREI